MEKLESVRLNLGPLEEEILMFFKSTLLPILMILSFAGFQAGASDRKQEDKKQEARKQEARKVQAPAKKMKKMQATMAKKKKGKVMVTMETNQGTLEIELFQDKAPETVKNFLSYVNEGFYNGTIFHRVIPTFMIQGGGFTKDMKQKKTKKPIKNEATNGLSNGVGTLAMARTSDPNSATAQFFINVANNSFLDKANAQDGFGYAVFGKVTKGMDEVITNKIKKVKTKRVGPHEAVPIEPVIITKVSVK